ncbi:MAG TPA: N-acetyl-D-Glu racemase DgcA [Micropepsaceae bacterium]|nr:N-acetyl-D-Glu racemase DgcA [Micropepsaceae bacterium]
MSARRLTVRVESWPIKGSFRIARGAKTEAHVVVAEIADGDTRGRGECVPYARYGETVESVRSTIESAASDIANGLTREELSAHLKAGAARNALDCALIDWEAKRQGVRAYEILGLAPPKPVRTAFTLSLDAPDAMGRAAAEAAAKGYRLLKLKVAGGEDLARIEAVRAAAPGASLITDANEGWSFDDLTRLAPELAKLGVSLIEQPLKASEDEPLARYSSPVPLCADESCHTRKDLPRILGRYDHINVKLDKTGGLTEAVELAREAQAKGLKLMVGCMVSTSLSMAPAALIAGMAAFVDLDGPLLLARDREPGLTYRGDVIEPPPRELWG